MQVHCRRQALVQMDEVRARRHRDVLRARQRARRRCPRVQRPVGLNRARIPVSPPPAVPIVPTLETPLFPPLLESIVSERIGNDDEDTSLVSRLQKKLAEAEERNLALRASLRNHIQEREGVEDELQRARQEQARVTKLVNLTREKVMLLREGLEEIARLQRLVDGQPAPAGEAIADEDLEGVLEEFARARERDLAEARRGIWMWPRPPEVQNAFDRLGQLEQMNPDEVFDVLFNLRNLLARDQEGAEG